MKHTFTDYDAWRKAAESKGMHFSFRGPMDPDAEYVEEGDENSPIVNALMNTEAAQKYLPELEPVPMTEDLAGALARGYLAEAKLTTEEKAARPKGGFTCGTFDRRTNKGELYDDPMELWFPNR